MANGQSTINRTVLSLTGILIMAVILIGINVIAGVFHFRGDLTENGIYTLSEGTKKILDDLKASDQSVKIRFYYSKDIKSVPANLKSYGKRVQDFLKEYEVYSDGAIQVEKVNPKPDSDAEDAAMLAGLEGRRISRGKKFYMGLALSMMDTTEAIPFLKPSERGRLEYKITRAVTELKNPEQKKIGVISSLPVLGKSQGKPQGLQQLRQQQGQEPWFVMQQLKENFKLEKIKNDASTISDDLSLLMLIHPKELSDKTLFAVDQYLLNGGKVAVFLDPMSFAEQQNQKNRMPMRGPRSGSSLSKFLQKWGLSFSEKKIVADLVFKTTVQRTRTSTKSIPGILTLPEDAMNQENPATSKMDNVILAASGAFSGTPTEGLEKEVLVHSSEEAQLVNKLAAQVSSDKIMQHMKGTNSVRDVIVHLTGKFKTAFPQGAPSGKGGTEGNAGNSQQGQKGATGGPHRKESSGNPTVLLVGDSDILADSWNVRQQRFLGQKTQQRISKNADLVQNLVGQMAGEDALLSIRSRGTEKRPFSEIQERQAEARQKYQTEIQGLEKELQETEQKLRNLQKQKSQGQQEFVLSEEQKETLQKFREKKVEINEKLEDLRRKYRKDIEALKNKLKFANIALMPIIVTCLGLGIAFIKWKKVKGSKA